VFGFDVTGPSGSNVVIQASPELQTWIPLQTNLLGSGLLTGAALSTFGAQEQLPISSFGQDVRNDAPR
jgi:hypothetical protein